MSNNPDGNPRSGGDVNSSPEIAPNSASEKKPLTKTLIVMDSNSKHLTEDLWKNSSKVFSPKAQQLITRMPQLIAEHKPSLLLIHNGTNDLDTTDGATVARNLLQIVQQTKQRTPHVRIIVSEIPPRKAKDKQVQICNEHLHTYFDPMEGVSMAIHSNLRTEDWEFYEDDKHLKRESIAKFAANLKVALRDALGIKLQRQDNKRKKRKSPSNTNSTNLEKLTREFLVKLGVYKGK